MSVSFSVHCDCFERGRIKTPPKPNWGVYIGEDGGLDANNNIHSNESNEYLDWCENGACVHKWGKAIVGAHLNIAGAGLLRQIVSQSLKTLPIIMGQVIYNGISYNIIKVKDLPALKLEIDGLSSIHAEIAENEIFLRNFETEIRQIVDTALRLLKPVSRG